MSNKTRPPQHTKFGVLSPRGSRRGGNGYQTRNGYLGKSGAGWEIVRAYLACIVRLYMNFF